ncbi:MAG: antibiotic biosynthesis monooxygenase, partial [Hafniaceae bacterium]|nr:antibiotic biosynthesis monooxygenase [Hafniaceae bacterium]
MIAVIFEAKTNSNQQERYLQLANELRPLLEEIEGFIGIER